MKKVILISSLLLATALAANSQEIFDSLRPAATTSTSISETTVSLASDISNGEDRPSRKGGPSNLLAQSSPQVKNGSANASTTKVIVPEGNPIVVDGIFSKGEWDDASKLPISEDYNLYLKVVIRFIAQAASSRSLSPPKACAGTSRGGWFAAQ